MIGRDLAEAPSVELRVWRQFLVLTETLHFGRAAQRLHITQPPLTQAIQKLEAQLGVRLFERTRRAVALTAAGAALVAPVRQALRDTAALPALARAAAAGENGRVRLGFVSTVGFGPLPTWLRTFRGACPGVSVELHEATGDVQLAALERGELDAGILLHAPGMPPVSPRPLHRLSVGLEPLVLALPAPATAPRRLRGDPRRLLDRSLVMFPRRHAPSLHDAVLAFFHEHGLTPRIAQEAIQMQTIVNLVSAGLGMALVPRSVAQLRRRGVEYRPVPPALASRAPSCETSLVWPPDAAPAVLRFVEHVRTTAA